MCKVTKISSALTLVLVLQFGSQSLAMADWAKQLKLLKGAPHVEGSQHRAISEKGPVIVTFFASWCPPCTDEFLNLNEVWADLGGKPSDRLTGIVAVNLHENFGNEVNQGRMDRFIERTDPQFPLIKGNEKISNAFGGIDRIPTVVVIDSKGQEIWRFVHKTNATKTHVTKQEVLDFLNRSGPDQ